MTGPKRREERDGLAVARGRSDWLRLPASGSARGREPGGLAAPGRRRRAALLSARLRAALLPRPRPRGLARGRLRARDAARLRSSLDLRPRQPARGPLRPDPAPVAGLRPTRGGRSAGKRAARAGRRGRLRHLDARGRASALRRVLRRAGLRPQGRRQDPAGRSLSADAAQPRIGAAARGRQSRRREPHRSRARRHAQLGPREPARHPHGARAATSSGSSSSTTSCPAISRA